jgi:hypothetical protein
VGDREILIAGWLALRDVEAHDLDGCQPCRRYAAALWQRAKPREVDHLRCDEMRAAQRVIDDAIRIVLADVDSGPPAADLESEAPVPVEVLAGG